MDERMEFMVAYESGLYSVTELADRFGISRKTAYKLIRYMRAEGPAGLADHSRRPHHSPRATPVDLVADIVACRQQHPRWGPKKLHAVLTRGRPSTGWPAPSTMALILKRQGLTLGRRHRPRSLLGLREPYVAATEPNVVWTTDFKGQFRTGDARVCYPLTIMDRYSRYLLACRALAAPTFVEAQGVFRRVFRTVGLPRWIHSDNGEPFGANGLARLSRLQVWWIRLGILPEPIRPARPDENAEHERMHRTLKAETARPPAATGPAQQRRFDCFRAEYNEERPHEALGMRPPSTLYHRSPREYPAQVPPLEYPGHFEVRRVAPCGVISWQGRPLFLSEVLRHERVGLEEIDDGVWDVVFGPVILGRFDARTRTLVGTRHLRLVQPPRDPGGDRV